MRNLDANHGGTVVSLIADVGPFCFRPVVKSDGTGALHLGFDILRLEPLDGSIEPFTQTGIHIAEFSQ